MLCTLAVVGCSTSRVKPDSHPPPTAAVFVSGYGPDISVFELDRTSGALTKRSHTQGGKSPSYLAFSHDHAHAYAINEADAPDSQVLAFSIARPHGALRLLNSAASGGSGAPHLAIHPSGKWLAVAHYGSGHTSVLSIEDDGRVGPVTHVNKGPNHGCANAHQAVFERSGSYLFVPCLGSDYILQFKFDSGQLSYNDPPTVAVQGGPRHFAFAPDQARAYVLSEHASIITSFAYDARTGRLSDPHTIPSYEREKGSSAHIAVHPSGKWLYASNRAENSIGVFALDRAGRPHPVSFVTEMIATPRDFSIDPTGRFLIAANQHGAQNVLVFRIDAADGRLTRASVAAVGGQPTFTQALSLSP